MQVTNLIRQSYKAAERIDWWHLTVDGVPMVYQAMELSGYIRTCWGTFFDCSNQETIANSKQQQYWLEVPYYLPLDTDNPQKTLKHLQQLALLQ
jgi:hypothetical protein